MTKKLLKIAALMLCSAAVCAPMPPPAHTGSELVLSASPDGASLKQQWRVDFVPQRGNREPPFLGRLLVFDAGTGSLAQVLTVTAYVPLREVRLAMRDVDGDGNPDIIFSGGRALDAQRPVDAVYLWSPPRGLFLPRPARNQLELR